MAPRPKNLSPTEESNPSDYSSGDRVVISGVSGLYPDCSSVKDLSNILYNKINPIRKENSRWNYEHPELSEYTGQISGLEYFDAQFFKVHYRLGNNMDPMSRKLLEQAYQAIYDAGVCPDDIYGQKVGVFIGSCFSETEKACFYVPSTRTGLGIAGCNKAMFANRISYWLNAKGPSMSIDAACCSSTEALCQAYRAINSGQCEAAIVGGAHICLHPQSSIHYGRTMKLSMDGKTKSFGSEAAGSAKSEAVAVLFLQKAKDALRIYSEIVYAKSEFTMISQEETGPKFGFYRDPENMAGFIRTFYEEAKVPPQSVEYVEAFGSAVPEADKAELEAIEKVYCKNRNDPLLVGSVMSNIGYGEAVSGISAITKIVLGYHCGMIAGNMHCDSPRQDIAALKDGRMRIVTDNQPFKRSYTAVNGLSVTGMNTHVLLNGHYKPKDLTRYKTNIPHLVTISARQQSSVDKLLQDLKSRPVDPEELALLLNIHKTRNSGHLGRGFIILDTNENNETISLCEMSSYFDAVKRPLWFVYSGMGSQWAGMGEMLMKIPVFAAAIERCRLVLEPKGLDIVHIITSPDKSTFDNILNSFVGIAAIQIGLTDVLRELEMFPDMIIGHSVGELGCAYADGCFTAEEMILAAYSRGIVSLQTPFIRGSMAAVGIGYQQMSKMCPPEIEVACHNGPNSCTISGPADNMKQFVAELTAKNIFAKEVPCSNIAYHSRYIADAGPGLLKLLSDVISSPKPRSKRWVSTSVPQDKWNDPIAKYSSAEYHTNNLLNPVLFEETSKHIPSNAVVVEIAPHGLLQAILKRSLPSSCKHVPLTKRGHSDNAQFLLQAIGKLYIEGYNPKVQALYPKIEFPVSTGTPLLSHLVEWAHTEVWFIPYYATANRIPTAARTYVISTHDDDHSYLKGHVMTGQNTYPFAATLVAVWDTLAMVLNVPKKTLSVQFRDVQLHTQPILYDHKLLQLRILLHRGTGFFEVLDDNNKVATGYVISKQDQMVRFDEEFKTEEVMELQSKDIYQILETRDCNVSDDFRTIHSANMSLTKANIIWNGNWVTFINGIILLNSLKRIQESALQPDFIRTINIDVESHLKVKTLHVDDTTVLRAEINNLKDITRCGGVEIADIKFHDLPLLNKKRIALNALKFVPHVTTNSIDENSALSVFLQITAENLNKQDLSVVEVVESEGCTNFKNIQEIIDCIPELQIDISQICWADITKQPNDFFKNTDLIMITNLSTNEKMNAVLHRLIGCDTFVINKEDYSVVSHAKPSLQYRNLSTHSTESSRLELIKWESSEIKDGSSAVTVSSQGDILKLSAQVATLPPNHRFTILTAYPAFDELKDFVKEWRSKDRNINTIIINNMTLDQQCLDKMPFADLATNIFKHGVWGGEYYLPITENVTNSYNLALEVQRLGDIDSLSWIEATEDRHPGVPVKIHYAGLNDAYVKRVLGLAANASNANRKLIEYDFSGTTDRKARVMGVVQEELISSQVKVKPELLWPVPEHWTLEDAATVPLAYCQAFYYLCVQCQLYSGHSILVHGGAGALGQAIISISLAHGCEVYTTVSNNRKKLFLLKLFPELKADHIGHSRESSFKDMTLYNTKGKGCNIVISCVKGELRNASMECCARFGVTVDTSIVLDNEPYIFGMNVLKKCLSVNISQFSSIFEPQNEDILKRLQRMVSQGIARGYVRPLSRVVYEPEDTARALRLQVASRNVGRVLLHLKEDISCSSNKIYCLPERLQLILSDNEILGVRLVERLIRRGARNLALQFSNETNSLLFKLRCWEKQGVKLTATYGNTWNENIFNLLNSETPENIEGIYFISNCNVQRENISKYLEQLTLEIQRDNLNIKYFAIIDAAKNVRDQLNIGRCHETIITIKLPPVKELGKGENEKYLSAANAVDAIEKSLCHKRNNFSTRIITVHKINKDNGDLLQEIAGFGDIVIPNEISPDKTLIELGMDHSKSQLIQVYLRDVHNILLDEHAIPLLTIKKIRELDNNISKKTLTETEGLKTFFFNVDQDVLLATTEIVFLPTLAVNEKLRADEFVHTNTYLCIIPGVDGSHLHFHEFCLRLKIPALVLQPDVARPHDTIKEMAQRYAKILLNKTKLKERFFLLGYESGVLVALETAAILEEHGLTGTVFCIGGGPDEIQEIFNEKLAAFDTEESLQVAVAQHMFTLLANDENSENLESELKTQSTWKEKVNMCIQKLRGRIENSLQYSQELILAAYARIIQVRQYCSELRPLKSLLIDIRPCPPGYKHVKSMSLQEYSRQQIVKYELQASLANATQDLSCVAIINRHLDEDILKEFENKNLCHTYINNNDSYMSVK